MDCKSIIQSSSSSQMIWKFDVFVSFRGEDTRNSFTDHLFGAFLRKGIVAFRDDRKLKKGESISTELMQALEGSQVFIVVFSKNYATSTWCLQELTKIVDCIKVTRQRVLPVFYDVSPSEVRKQSGDYGKAFARHEETFKEDLEMVQRWREALVEVAGLAGWDVCNKTEYGEIEKIVKEVIRIMGYKYSSLSNDLVGMHSRVEQLERLLVLDSNDDVQIIGVCGMGGIGKTTLATELYNRLSHQYDSCCFIDDVSKTYGDSGPIGAQKQLLCQTLKEENLEVWSHSKATYMIKTRLRHVKVLIVLDNVDKVEQLEKLAVTSELLCAGSRIIIISRDEHILREYGVDKVYKVQLLKWVEARQLFCRKAFKCDDIMREYEELTDCAIRYAEGLPLAIKVLGSFLYGRDISEWRGALARLKDNPKKEIMDVLQISFDGLEPTEKEIFLDIACFFGFYPEKYVKRVLNCCGFHPDIGIRVLIDKSLINLEDGSIRMHDMLQELGKKIVREKAPNEPGKWSRLWCYEDFHNVMHKTMAMDNIEAIQLKDIHFGESVRIRAEALSKMSRLRLLILKGNVKVLGSLNCLSNQLRYLEWEHYPVTRFPSSCELTKLVEFILPYSNIKQLWEGIKPLHNLKIMNLRRSKNLVKTPDFKGIPNLEQLDLQGCTKLVWINPSIGLLRKLVEVNLENCTSLVGLPKSILCLSSLEVLNLSGCSRLEYYQLLKKARHTEHLKKLDISDTAIQRRSVYKRQHKPFHFYNSIRHRDIASPLMHSFPHFPCLRDLDLSFCNLAKIPDAILLLHCLERLDLAGNKFVTLPCGIKELPRLASINLAHCKQLTALFEFPLGTVPGTGPVRRSNTIYRDRPRLLIFNCPKLVEVAESWSSMTVSWMIQVLQVYKESCPPITVVIPGAQIPSWFNCQSVGNSICIQPFPNVHDSNWIGLAFCAAFVIQDGPTPRWGTGRIATSFFCRIRSGKGVMFLSTRVDIEKDMATAGGLHLYLHYFTRQDLINVRKADVTKLKIEFVRLFQPQLWHLEVKNCGVRLVYKQDLE